MPEPKWHWVERFPGMDTETDPLELGAKMMDGEGVMWTNDSLNGYGDGSYWQVRPGIRLATGQGTVISAIYELQRLALSSSTGSRGPDSLVGLSINTDAANTVRWTTWSVGTLPAIAVLNTVVAGVNLDTDRRQVFVPAGALRTMSRQVTQAGATQLFVLWNGTAYALGLFTGPTNPDGTFMLAGLAVYHKERLFLIRNEDPRYGSLVVPSVRGNPLQYVQGDTFVLDEDSTHKIQGGYSTGERLILGRSGSIFMLLGATQDRNRAVKISTRYGVAGVRGGDLIDYDQLLCFLTESGKPSGATQETPSPRNIGIIAGGELRVIGDRVLTDIRASADASRETQVQAWTALRGALLIPKRATTAAAVDALFYSTAPRNDPSAGFWKWTIGATIGACCLREAGGTMYLGTAGGGSNTGVIQYFDPTLATDNGTAFTARLSSPPYRSSEKKVIEEMIVVASQTSGTAANWTAQRRLPSGSYETAFSIVQTGAPTMNAYPQAFRFKFPTLTSGQAKADYINGWRINPPADGVGCRIHAVGWSDKGAGG